MAAIVTIQLSLGFVQFLHLSFVAWGAALVSIPIIIHILNRRRFKVVSWAAMDFLMLAMRRNRRRMKFEQLLLLATRCLLILLLALAVARPLVGCSRNSMASQLGGRSGLNVFVIDNSYSTAYDVAHTGGGKNHFEQEKLIVKRLIDTFNAGGESVAIITADRATEGDSSQGITTAAPTDAKAEKPSARIVMRPGYDLNAARAVVDRLEQSYGGTDLAGALQAALQLAQEDPKQPNKNLFILTDGTRSAWEGKQAEAVKRLGPDLAKNFHVTHYNMTEGRQQWNQSVAGVRPIGNLVTTKFDTLVLADARGYGSAPDATLQWSLDGAVKTRAAGLRLSPDEDKTNDTKRYLQILARDLKRGGPHVVVAAINADAAGDSLKLDDKRYRVIDVAAEVRVLIVEGKRGTSALEGSGAFLQLALAPPAETTPGSSEPKTNSYVSADLISDIDLQGKLLSDYKAIALTGVGQITEPQADALKQFVEAGGTLMVFTGEAVTKENYNAVLLPRKLLPGPLIKLMSDGAGYLFDYRREAARGKPFIGAFAAVEHSGLETAKVFNYWQADIAANPGVYTILGYRAPTDKNGAPLPGATSDPAITHHTLGLGHVVFVSTAAGPGQQGDQGDKQWTDLPARISYLELMHELLIGGLRPGDDWMNLIVGQQVQVPSYIKMNGSPDLRDENNAQILVEPVTLHDPKTGAPAQTVYRSKPLTRPGMYMLKLGDTGAFPIAVNVPADEADVRTIGNESIRHALGDIDVDLQNDELPSENVLAQQGNDWAGTALLIVLALLAFECLLAMLFGHYRRSEVVRA